MVEVGDIVIWRALGPAARVRVIATGPTLTMIEVLPGSKLGGARFRLKTDAVEQMVIEGQALLFRGKRRRFRFWSGVNYRLMGRLSSRQLRSRCCAAPIYLDENDRPSPLVRCEDCQQPCETVEIPIRGAPPQPHELTK